MRLLLISPLVFLLFLPGCAELVIHEDDHLVVKAGKVISRTLFGAASAGLTEVPIRMEAAMFAWEQEERDRALAFQQWWAAATPEERRGYFEHRRLR